MGGHRLLRPHHQTAANAVGDYPGPEDSDGGQSEERLAFPQRLPHAGDLQKRPRSQQALADTRQDEIIPKVHSHLYKEWTAQTPGLYLYKENSGKAPFSLFVSLIFWQASYLLPHPLTPSPNGALSQYRDSVV